MEQFAEKFMIEQLGQLLYRVTLLRAEVEAQQQQIAAMEQAQAAEAKARKDAKEP